MNRIELVSSSARVTSAKFHKVLDVCTDIERPGPIDRTPETPGSGKKTNNETVHLGFETVWDGFHKKTAFYTPLINGQEI